MKLTIDTTVIDKYDLTVDAFLLLMGVVHNIDIQRAKTELLQKGFVMSVMDLGDGVEIKRTKLGVDAYNNIILESSPQETVTDKRLEDLAAKMKEIYPKGKKDGTWYWADGVGVIARRLRIFFHKYDKKMSLTDEQIIRATEKYVAEMEGKPDMRLLKYFIFKEPVGKGGDVEPVSDLLTYIENLDQVDESSDETFVTLF